MKIGDSPGAEPESVNKLPARPQPIGRFDKTWKRACQAAGLPGLIVHDFRRSAVRNYTRAGAPEAVVMAITGHKTRSVFDRYNITSTEDIRTAVRSLDRYLECQPAESKIIPLQQGAPRVSRSRQTEHGYNLVTIPAAGPRAPLVCDEKG